MAKYYVKVYADVVYGEYVEATNEEAAKVKMDRLILEDKTPSLDYNITQIHAIKEED